MCDCFRHCRPGMRGPKHKSPLMLHPNDVWTLVESEFNASPISLCTPLLERASFAPREKACILTY